MRDADPISTVHRPPDLVQDEFSFIRHLVQPHVASSLFQGATGPLSRCVAESFSKEASNIRASHPGYHETAAAASLPEDHVVAPLKDHVAKLIYILVSPAFPVAVAVS
jgi:hypothetical protein